MPFSDLDSHPSGVSGDCSSAVPRKNRASFLKEKRGCLLRFFLIGLAVVFVLLLILNGPGFRKIGEVAITKIAEKQGYKGQVSIEGTLWSGFALKDGLFTSSDQSLRELKLGEVSVQYSVPRLIREQTNGFTWLEVVRVKDISVDLVLPETAVEEPVEKTEDQPKAEPVPNDGEPSPFWDLLNSTIVIENISANIRQGEKQWSIKGFSFDSLAGKDGSLSIRRLEIPGAAARENISTVLRKGPMESLTLGPLKILDPVEIVSLTVQEAVKSDPLVSLKMNLSGGHIDAAFSPGGTASLSLAPGTVIRLPDLIALSGNETKTDGQIDGLNLDFSGDFGAPNSWEIKGRLDSSGIQWDKVEIESANLVLDQNVISLNVKRPDTELNVKARVSLSDAKETAQLADLPIYLDGDFKISDIESLLAGFAEKDAKPTPLSGAVSGQISGLQIINSRTLTNGTITIDSDNLAWEEIKLDGLDIAAVVETKERISINGNLKLDDQTEVVIHGGIDQENLSYEAKATLTAQTVEKLEQILRKYELNEKIRGKLVLDWEGSGDLAENTHNGNARLAISEARISEGLPFVGNLRADYNGRSAQVPYLILKSGKVQINGKANWDGKVISLDKLNLTKSKVEQLSMSAKVPFDPESKSGFLNQLGPIDMRLKTNAMPLESLTRFFAQKAPIEGTLTTDLTAFGPFSKIVAKGDLNFIPEIKLAGDDSLLSTKLDLSGDIQKPATWSGTLDTELGGLVWDGKPLEQISVHAKTTGEGAEKKAVADISMEQSGTTLKAYAILGLGNAETCADLAKEPIALDANLNIGAVERLLADFAPQILQEFPMSGKLAAEVKGLQLQDGHFVTGEMKVESETLALSGQVFTPLSIDADIPETDIVDVKIDLGLDGDSGIDAVGKYNIDTQTYEGDLNVRADTVSKGKLHHILKGRSFAKLLPGNTRIEWKGSGDVKQKTHTGTADVVAENFYLADGAEAINIAMSGTYSADSADIQKLTLRSDPLNLDGQVLWKDNVLSIPKLTGTHGGRNFLDLTLSAPLDKEKLTANDWFQQDDPVSVNAKVDRFPISAAMRLFQSETPVEGDVSLDLQISGKPRDLTANGKLNVVKIVVPKAGDRKDDIDVGKLSLDLAIAKRKANIEGQFNHPEVKPFDIKANVPFYPAEWATNERKIADEKISASVKMDRSALDFLETQVPGIESIDGTVAIDATVSGTINQPSIRGNGFLDVSRFKLESRDAPTFRDIETAIHFADNAVTIERFHAIVAGGIVDVSGGAKLPPNEPPFLDLVIKGQEVLLARTPDVTVRTNIDLSIRGPWDQAALAGEIGITNSRFFKVVDVLPVGGLFSGPKKKSVLPTVERVPSGGGAAVKDLDIGVPIEPFKNWPLDVKLVTHDPFRIEGNLAQSAVVADIHIGGNLGHPVPNGKVSIEKGKLTLPFSKVDLEFGKITFNEGTGFNGNIELKARAKTGDHRITVFGFNRITDPKVVFSCVPPLPREDIMTLLATGSTRDKFVGSDAGSVAATKAAMLLFKKMKKTKVAGGDEHTLLDELQDRTELELGRVNPETGQQTFGGKIRLWKQLFFVGDVDSESDYRALLKYVFRFR